MKNADMPAMPLFNSNGAPLHHSVAGMENHGVMAGLTKREVMAMHIMGGLISGGHLRASDAKQMPELAVLMADMLLAELERTNGQ